MTEEGKKIRLFLYELEGPEGQMGLAAEDEVGVQWMKAMTPYLDLVAQALLKESYGKTITPELIKEQARKIATVFREVEVVAARRVRFYAGGMSANYTFQPFPDKDL